MKQTWDILRLVRYSAHSNKLTLGFPAIRYLVPGEASFFTKMPVLIGILYYRLQRAIKGLHIYWYGINAKIKLSQN